MKTLFIGLLSLILLSVAPALADSGRTTGLSDAEIVAVSDLLNSDPPAPIAVQADYGEIMASSCSASTSMGCSCSGKTCSKNSASTKVACKDVTTTTCTDSSNGTGCSCTTSTAAL